MFEDIIEKTLSLKNDNPWVKYGYGKKLYLDKYPTENCAFYDYFISILTKALNI